MWHLYRHILETNKRVHDLKCILVAWSHLVEEIKQKILMYFFFSTKKYSQISY
jgi:hypothetical protein